MLLSWFLGSSPKLGTCLETSGIFFCRELLRVKPAGMGSLSGFSAWWHAAEPALQTHQRWERIALPLGQDTRACTWAGCSLHLHKVFSSNMWKQRQSLQTQDSEDEILFFTLNLSLALPTHGFHCSRFYCSSVWLSWRCFPSYPSAEKGICIWQHYFRLHLHRAACK